MGIVILGLAVAAKNIGTYHEDEDADVMVLVKRCKAEGVRPGDILQSNKGLGY